MRQKNKNSSCKEYWIAKGYSEEEAKFKIKVINPSCKEYWIAKGYSEEEAINKIQCNNPTTKLYWIAKGYSEEEATIKIREKRKICKEYWIAKGYSEEEAIKLAKSISIQQHSECKEYWIAKGYSEEEANKLCLKINIKHSKNLKSHFTREQNRFCKEYWVAKGYSEEEAIKLAKLENKTTTSIISKEKRKCITKNVWNKFSKSKLNKIYKKISKTLKLKHNCHSPIFKEYWIAKGYSEEEAHKKIINIKHQFKNKTYKSSKIETKFFIELELYLNLKFKKQNWVTINHHSYCQDGKYKNYVLEFFGSAYHMDDRFYTNKMKNPVGKLFEDVKKYDKQKISDYMIKQYNIIIVWEYDYLNNKIELFKKLKEILYEKNNKCGSYWNSASFFNKC